MKKLCLLTATGILSLNCLSLDAAAAEARDTARTTGTVTRVMEEDRTLSISHAPIPEWQWPQMTMNFEVADDVDISQLEEGSEIEFELTRREEGGEFITELQLEEEEE